MAIGLPNPTPNERLGYSLIANVVYDGVQQGIAQEIRRRISGQVIPPEVPFPEKKRQNDQELNAVGPNTGNGSHVFAPELYIMDLMAKKPKEGLIKIQFVPKEIDYRPESNFVAIKSMGRNNPFYHYTGAEDVVSFDISWFWNEEECEDVLRNCKKLEALTKNNGFDEEPHHVAILWNTKMFGDATWLLVSAPYSLSQWNAGYINKSGNTVNTAMMPRYAIQKLTFKRIIPANTTSEDINRITF